MFSTIKVNRYINFKASALYFYISVVLVALLFLFFTGCTKKPTGSSRNIHTPNYYESALTWDSNLSRWIFFSWQGTNGTIGSYIYINVHDGTSSVPSNFNATAARNALINGREIWKSAIREAGYTCESSTKYERDGDTFTSKVPRIDVRFVRQLNNGLWQGATQLTYQPSTRTFSYVTIYIATEWVSNGKVITMTDADYWATFANEFGHAFGIYGFGGASGHSPNPNDVMYERNTWWTLSDGDKATIKIIYGSDAYYKPYGYTLDNSMPKEPLDLPVSQYSQE